MVAEALAEARVVAPVELPFMATLLLSKVFKPVIDSAFSSVESVPEVGSVTEVRAVVLSVVALAPVVVRLPPRVIVLPVFATPVPPFAPVTMPVTLAAVPDTLPVTSPVRLAEIVPAEKFPEASRRTMVPAVLRLVAVVAELETLPGVVMAASLVSAIAAVADILLLSMAPAATAGEAAVPARSPASLILPFSRLVASGVAEVIWVST